MQTQKAPAYEEGQAAFARGHRLYNNPYADETLEHTKWADGWHDAHDKTSIED